MKLVVAIIQPHQLPAVKQALYAHDVFHMMCTNILGTVPNHGERQTFRGVAHEVELFQKVRVEVICTDDRVGVVTDAIVEGGKASGETGLIFVTEIVDCVSVSTGERGTAAL